MIFWDWIENSSVHKHSLSILYRSFLHELAASKYSDYSIYIKRRFYPLRCGFSRKTIFIHFEFSFMSSNFNSIFRVNHSNHQVVYLLFRKSRIWWQWKRYSMSTCIVHLTTFNWNVFSHFSRLFRVKQTFISRLFSCLNQRKSFFSFLHLWSGGSTVSFFLLLSSETESWLETLLLWFLLFRVTLLPY